MNEMEALYFRLFAATADAIDKNDGSKAKNILIQAQQQAEEAYIKMGETQTGDA